MVYVIGAILALAIFGELVYPLLRPAARDGAPEAPPRGQDAPQPAQERLAELLAQRDAAFQAIRELRFDHEVGKITGEDLAAFEAGLRGRAAEALQRLDAWETETDRELAALVPVSLRLPGTFPARTGSPGPAAGPRIEERVAARRAELAGRRPCPACGRVAGPDDAFCTGCGRALSPQNPDPSPALPKPACPVCGRAVAPDDRFCPGCGQRLEAAASPAR